MSDKDTIVALSTASGRAALAIVRLSGPDAFGILSRIFVIKGAGGESPVRERYLTHGSIINPDENEEIDTVLVAKMAAPNSYTGEDVVEITCHGSPAVVRGTIELSVAQGARVAEPGEFTKRAFLNGKMDLAQAEAVADLISSETAASSKIALRQVGGHLSKSLSEVKQNLVEVAAEIEARIDFPDEDLGVEDKQRLQEKLEACLSRLKSLLKDSKAGRLLREGVRIPIVGKPNTGKSSLFNTLLRRERSIVSAHPGTTRDTVESTVELQGMAVTFIDTAGMRARPDEIEQLGISRTESEIADADLVLFLLDRSDGINEEDKRLYGLSRSKEHMVVLNKMDMKAKISADRARKELGIAQDTTVCEVSALYGRNIKVLEARIVELLLGKSAGVGAFTEEIMVTNIRHIEALRRARDGIQKSISGLKEDVSSEFIMVDLQEALREVSGILGERVDDAVLDKIFSTFCIGK